MRAHIFVLMKNKIPYCKNNIPYYKNKIRISFGQNADFVLPAFNTLKEKRQNCILTNRTLYP